MFSGGQETQRERAAGRGGNVGVSVECSDSQQVVHSEELTV